MWIIFLYNLNILSLFLPVFCKPVFFWTCKEFRYMGHSTHSPNIHILNLRFACWAFDSTDSGFARHQWFYKHQMYSLMAFQSLHFYNSHARKLWGNGLLHNIKDNTLPSKGYLINLELWFYEMLCRHIFRHQYKIVAEVCS